MRKKIYIILGLMLVFGLFNINGSFAQSCTCEGHGYGYAGDCCHPSTGSSCGNCGTIDCGGSCSGQGVCSPGSTQCVNGDYQSCTSSCGWDSSAGTDSDNDQVDQQCEDTTCDNAAGVCDTAVANKCIVKSSPEICTDGLDNDCNGFADSKDSFCDGGIRAFVADQNNDPIEGVKITRVDKDLNTLGEDFTDASGWSGWVQVPFGNHTVIASHPDYVSKAKPVQVDPFEQAEVLFADGDSLVIGSTCEPDCTYTGDNTVHKGCDQINSCNFYDAVAAQACDNAQPGWIRNYNETHVVQCAPGVPQEEIKVKATVTCEEENLIKSSQIVNYRGKLVNMVVVTCG